MSDTSKKPINPRAVALSIALSVLATFGITLVLPEGCKDIVTGEDHADAGVAGSPATSDDDAGVE